MAHTTEPLQRALKHLPPARRYWVAYSGGLDSTVLLHLAASLPDLRAALHAIHVDHGLSPRAAEWEAHCARTCHALNIPYRCARVSARAAPGESPEAAARTARYRAFDELLEAGDCLLTAHHQDDQAETLLLQLLRGAGVAGLAAMPGDNVLGRGRMARPLLAVARSVLQDYAVHHRLRWVEDESNFDPGFDRNYLRHELMPRLTRRWPAAARTLARSAHHAADAEELLGELAALDMVATATDRGILELERLRTLSAARQRNLLRHWLRTLGLPLPSSAVLGRIQDEVLTAAPDREPLVEWPGAQVRRYREHLYAMPPLTGQNVAIALEWDLTAPLTLPDGACLVANAVVGAGLRSTCLRGQKVTVRLRQGGERCRPAGRSYQQALKKLLQAAAVPPWERDRIPLVFVGEQLAQVVGLWYCEPFQARDGEPGFVIHREDSPTSRR